MSPHQKPPNYTFRLAAGRIAPEWTRQLHFADDASAIAGAETILQIERMSRGRAQPVSVLVGRGVDQVTWLGAWRWELEPEWAPA